MIYSGRRGVGGFGGRENDIPTQPIGQRAPQQNPQYQQQYSDYQQPYQPPRPNYRYIFLIDQFVL